MSIWDTYVRRNGTIDDGSTGDDACKSYEFYQKDVDALKNMGVRFCDMNEMRTFHYF